MSLSRRCRTRFLPSAAGKKILAAAKEKSNVTFESFFTCFPECNQQFFAGKDFGDQLQRVPTVKQCPEPFEGQIVSESVVHIIQGHPISGPFHKYTNEFFPHRKDAKLAWFDKLTMVGLSRSP